MDISNNDLYKEFLQLYDIILEKQFNTISNSEYFFFISNIKATNSKNDLKKIKKTIDDIKTQLSIMNDVFFYEDIKYQIEPIVSFFNKNITFLYGDLMSKEMKNKFFYSFKFKNGMIEKYINDIMLIISDMVILVSKILYKNFINYNIQDFETLNLHIDFIEILKDFTLYLFTKNITSNNEEFYKILEKNDYNIINDYIQNLYENVYSESLNIIKNIPYLCDNCVNFPKLEYITDLLMFFNTDETLVQKLPLFYEKQSLKINFIIEDIAIYINNIIKIFNDENLLKKYLNFTNVFLLSDEEYDEDIETIGLIKSIFSTYLKTNEEVLMFNFSHINLPENKSFISYRNYDKKFFKNITIDPKNIKLCYNVLENEIRSDDNAFIWNNWGAMGAYITPSKNFSIVNTNELYTGQFNISSSLFKNVTGADHRYQKIYVEQDISKYKNKFDDMDPFNENNEYYYVLLHDTSLYQFNIIGLKKDKIFLKEYLVSKDSNLYKHVDIGKNKNYSFVENYINGDNELIFIFSEWFYKDGLKFLYINLENFNMISLETVYDNIKISGVPKDENYPYFSFTTNSIKYNSIYIGVGHTKIKNGYDNKQCNIQKSITDFINYSTYGKSYIRHFGAYNVNQLYYNDGEYKNNRNKNLQQLEDEGVNEDYYIMNGYTKCAGFQYYMFFYIFEFEKDTNKLRYFKISNSFIPRIKNYNKTFENYNYSLIFPMSLILENDTVMISGGEGDCRSFLLQYNIVDILDICKFDIQKIDINDYMFYPCT